MIARHWQGLAKPQHADAYVEHLRTETFPALKAIPGFISAIILRRAVPQGVEFQIITHWQSLDVIRAFAGVDAEAAVVPRKVREMMIEFEPRARHYEVVA